MNASLKALLTQIIDYAGMFPPARLPLRDAVHNYAEYLRCDDAWMLGRFICQTGKFEELAQHHGLFDQEHVLTVSALARGGTDAREFRDGAARDVNAMASLRRALSDCVVVDVVEAKLPDDVQDLALDDLAAFLQQTHDQFNHHSAVKVFFEIALDDDWPAKVDALLQAICAVKANDAVRPGFKLRCGGLEASVFPTVEQVAYCLLACARSDVPFKATAGLHHPIRHFATSVQTMMHGFINVFGGGVLGKSAGLDEETMTKILSEEDASRIVFDDDALRYGESRIACAEITQFRRSLFTSFGSCSFDEPREDLRALGWMP